MSNRFIPHSIAARLPKTRTKDVTYQLLFASTAITLASMLVYVMVRLTTVWADGYTVLDAILAVLLLGAEFFLMLHGIGYFLSVVKAAKRDAMAAPLIFTEPVTTPVAVLVCAFNEPEDVVDQTLAAIRAMDYPAVNIYLLDDSTKGPCREAAKRLAERYGATLRLRADRTGHKAGAINDVLPDLVEKWVALLDADQRPVQAWLKDVVPLLERDSNLAMVQAPQIYVNTESLPVAAAARFQQAVFFEYICEGKAYSNAIYCCGSNTVLSREALMSVEVEYEGRRTFFDESSVTEDFATSLRWHANGWRTEYVNEPYVLGMGPETLPAYFTQHMRWAMGSMAIGLRVLGLLLRNPRMLTPGQWWEYLLSGFYYFVGFANLIFIFAPVLFILGGVTPLHTSSDVYLMFFIPYIIFTMNLFFFGMKLRKYPIKGVWLASALSFSTTWTYAKAACVAIFGLKRAFAVTPKGVGGTIPLRSMPAELTLFLVNVVAALAGLYHLIFVELDTSFVVTTVWASYHAMLMSTLFFYFNRPVTIIEDSAMFKPASVAA